MILYYNDPFPHAIIYDHFDECDLKRITAEIKSLTNSENNVNKWRADDEHHSRLAKEFNVDSYLLDIIYDGRRNESDILHYITKVYEMTNEETLDSSKFRLLEYVKDSNADNTMLHGYKNGSSYYEHHDKAVLTFLYTFWGEPKPFTGGDLIFTKYKYKPELKSNCCLIFPSYERHEVTKLYSEQEGVVRWAMNQRIFIRN